MKRYALALLGCLIAAPAVAAESDFMMVTGSDIGRPYKVINGTCVFKVNPRLINPSVEGMLNSALQEAGKQLIGTAQKIGANAITNMTVTPLLIPDPVNPRDLLTNSGVFVCGTFVKFTE